MGPSFLPGNHRLEGEKTPLEDRPFQPPHPVPEPPSACFAHSVPRPGPGRLDFPGAIQGTSDYNPPTAPTREGDAVSYGADIKRCSHSTNQPYQVGAIAVTFYKEGTEAQRDVVTCPRSESWEMVEPRFKLNPSSK